MNGLKAMTREAISSARECRKVGLRRLAAAHLINAGEYRRTLFYVYGGHRS